MKTRPINFKANEVRATLEGRKTQKRLTVKWPVMSTSDGSKRRLFFQSHITQINELVKTRQTHPLSQCCPYGQPGDWLWVKETWRTLDSLEHVKPSNLRPGAPVEYRAGGHNVNGFQGEPLTGMGRWRPSIFMSKWMSRITLEIVSVRVERLQDISEDDAKREGLPNFDADGNLIHKGWLFEDLWNRIHGPGSWDLNPWVWVIEFKDAQ